MNNTIQLPASVVTPQDVARLELELTGFIDWFQHNAIKQHMHVSKGTAMPGLSSEAVELIRAVSVNGSLNQSNIESLQQAIMRIRQHAPTMSITLSAPAGAQLRQQLVAWCRSEIRPDVLVDFRFNATILGGMVVRYGSHVFDWSWRRAVLNNRSSFAKELRSV
ncbi:MAG: F0F1 ATP synthase subunit delta [Candidatus Saccharimonadales bacterium]